jgi:hypothetical protein
MSIAYSDDTQKIAQPQWVDTIRARYGDKSFKGLATSFMELKQKQAEAKFALKMITAEYDVLRLDIIPDKMDAEEMSSINLPGVGRLGVTLDLHVTVLAENREAFYEWLVEQGHADIIKPYAQPGTVKSFLKERVTEGDEIPEALAKVTPFYRASVTKK